MVDAVKPARVVQAMIEAGVAKTRLSVSELFVRSALAGAFLGVSTTLAFTAATQTGMPIVGALIFPVGFSMIVVLGLDLITGSFALMPMALMARKITFAQLVKNWIVTFVGNYVGGVGYRSMGDERRQLRRHHHGEQAANVFRRLCVQLRYVSCGNYSRAS